jgi:hypothetical protein
MDVRVPKVAVLKAATVAMVGFAMVCGLLILFGSMSGVAEAAPLAAGPTVITQDITIDTTWVVTDSPYIVSTDTVAVRNDSQLTIEPGVEVRFQSGAQLQLLDGGHLRAIGTTSQPITFTSNSLAPARGDWNGIRFNVDSLTGTIQYAVIEYGQIGFELSRPGQYYNVSTSTFRYIGTGNPDTSGAIIGVPDSSEFNYNTVYSSEIGFRLNKAFNNTFQGNEIYDIDTHCIALLSAGAGSPGGGENDFIDNQLHDCGANGIRLEGSGVSDNQIVSNVIWNTNNEGVYVANQSNLQFQSNTVYGTAFTTTTGAGSVGSNLGGVALIGVNGIIARDNYLHSNGAAASASYEGAFYIEDASGAGAMVITGSRVLDSNGSGLVFEGTIGPSSHTINNNAICVVPRYEVENRDGALTVSGNWLGTNSPAAGTEYQCGLAIHQYGDGERQRPGQPGFDVDQQPRHGGDQRHR